MKVRENKKGIVRDDWENRPNFQKTKPGESRLLIGLLRLENVSWVRGGLELGV